MRRGCDNSASWFPRFPLPPPPSNFGLECWVKSSPLGQGDSSGYTLIAYDGTPFYSGVGFFQHGKSYVVRVGSHEKVLAPASTTSKFRSSELSPERSAAGLAPSDTRESAIFTSVTPGNYTAIVRGAGNTTGVGLVEVYNLQ